MMIRRSNECTFGTALALISPQPRAKAISFTRLAHVFEIGLTSAPRLLALHRRAQFFQRFDCSRNQSPPVTLAGRSLTGAGRAAHAQRIASNQNNLELSQYVKGGFTWG
jgi:hypothetical protein